MGIFRKPCAQPGCPAIVKDTRYCEKHKEHETKSGFSDKGSDEKKFYNSTPWRKIRKIKLGMNPICEQCYKRQATVVHHIQRLKTHRDLALELTNLEALCASCHNRESQKEGMKCR